MKSVKLVLSGSGTRFPVFVGALKKLSEEGYTFEEVCGTSGGAIVASGLASGFSVKEMEELCQEFLPNLTQYIDLSFFTFLWKWGLIRGDRIEKEFSKKLAKTLGDAVIPIRVVTVNYDKSTDEEPYHVFTSTNDPDVSMGRAVRASMSIPLIFEPVEINGDRYIDGGIAANFPLDIYGDADNVIGLYMDPDPPKRKENRRWGLKGLAQYILDIVDIFINATTQEHIEDADTARVIPLKTDQDSLDFFITLEDVNDMIESGYKLTEKWLEEHI